MLQVHRAFMGAVGAVLVVTGCQGSVESGPESTSVLQGQCMEVCDDSLAECSGDEEGCEQKQDLCYTACADDGDEGCGCEAELDACLAGDAPDQPGECEGGDCDGDPTCPDGSDECDGEWGCGGGDCDGDPICPDGSDECDGESPDEPGGCEGGSCPGDSTCPDGMDDCDPNSCEDGMNCEPQPPSHEELCYARYGECQQSCEVPEAPCVSCIDEFQDCAWSVEYERDGLLKCADELYQCVDSCEPLPPGPGCDCMPTDCDGSAEGCDFDPNQCPAECWNETHPCDMCEVVAQNCVADEDGMSSEDDCALEVQGCYDQCDQPPEDPHQCEEQYAACVEASGNSDENDLACKIVLDECLSRCE